MNDKQQRLEAFAARLTQLRNEKNLSIRGLAGRAGLEYSAVQRIEQGKVNFEYTTLLKLADGLEITPSQLLDFPNF